MNIEDLIDDLDMIVGILNSEEICIAGWLALSNSAYEIRKILQKEKTMCAVFTHNIGDEVALITCPACDKNIIANLENCSEFNKDWYCKDCGQHLTLEDDDECEDFDLDVLGQPNCCDCEWTYNGGECDNCEWE